MRVIIFICAFSFAILRVHAQAVIPPETRAEFNISRFSGTEGFRIGEMLFGLPASSGNVIGDNYLSPNWCNSKIQLYENGKIIAGFPVKYDLKSEVIEIKSKDGIKVLATSKVKTFVILDSIFGGERYFVNARELRLVGTPLTGFLEVIVDGNTPLLKKTYLFAKEPTYNPALDIGSHDTKILKKEKFYFSKGKELNKIQGKKSLSTAFGEHNAEMNEYIKTNKLSTDEQIGLQRIFEFYNSKYQSVAN
jgi:hypothetical protein